MLYVYFGKAAAGKDYLAKKRIQEGVKKFVTCTTRPPRDDEIDGIDYHFLTAEKFDHFVETGHIYEHRVFHTTFGIAKYGSCDCYDVKQCDYVTALDVGGILAAVNKFGASQVTAIYVTAPDSIRKDRYLSRDHKATEAEWERRYKTDEIDFSTEKISQIKQLLGENFKVVEN